MARPADAVAHGLAADEMRRLECPELLQDPGPRCAEPRRELVGRGRAVEAEAQQQIASQARRAADGAGAALGMCTLVAGTDAFGSGIPEG